MPTIFEKPTILRRNWRLFENCRQNTLGSTETFTVIQLRRNFALYFTSYSSIALCKFLPNSKTLKNAEKLSVFRENESRRWSNFLQTHIFWNFDHISRIDNQINNRNNWFPKLILNLIMTTQVLFFIDFSEKDPHLNACEKTNNKSKNVNKNIKMIPSVTTPLSHLLNKIQIA